MKLLLKRFAIAGTIILISCETFASTKIGDLYYVLRSYDKTAYVTQSPTGLDYTQTTIEIPSKVNVDGVEYDITKIGSSAFRDCNSLTAIKIPNSIVEIDSFAFYGCSNLTTVEIPNSITSISSYAFYGCSSLSSVSIPTSVTSIDNSAFSKCLSLASIVLPYSIQKIGCSAFSECKNLKSINIPYSITEISDYTFSSCSSLQSIDMPSTITAIGEYAFEDCGLQSINLPNGLKHIGKCCFRWCANLNKVEIPSSLDSIPYSCFGNCHNLTNVKINNGVKSIGRFAFKVSTSPYIRCDFHIPPSVTHIGSQAFSKSQNVILYSGNTSIGGISDSECMIFVLDNNIPELTNDGLSVSAKNIFYVPDRNSFIKKTNYDSSKVFSIGEYGNEYNYESLIYDGTSSPLNQFGISSINSNLNQLNLDWYCEAFDVTDAGFYKGNSIIEIHHDDWKSSFPISFAFKIEPAPLTIKIKDCEKIYGEENPDFSYNLIGLCQTDNIETAFQQQPVITTICSLNSEVDQYPIVVSSVSTKNYNVSCEEGKLLVTKAPLKVAVNDTTYLYGHSNPKFKLSYEGFKLNDTEATAFSQLPTVTIDATVKSGVGVYPLIVNGGVARNYEVKEYIPGNLTITKAPLTLTANNAERFYHTENPPFDYTLTGLVNGDDKSCLSKEPEFACTASLTSGCGEYDIIPSNAESKNYDISYSNGKMTVAKSPLSISVVDVSREYGDPNPKFEFIYSGFKDGDDASSLSVLPKATCSARPNSPVGYYDIEVSGAESQNYDITYTPGILTVSAAPLTIRAKDVKKSFGTENPEFEISYFGFKNEDDESSLFRLPQINTSATTYSPVGTYSIVVSDAAAKNYNIIYEQGVLTVTKAMLTAKVKNSSRFYGEDDPQFLVEYSGFLNGDTEDVITTKPQIHAEADRTSKVGTYAIVANGASSSNYEFNYQNGELTVNPRQISASVGNYTRPYGAANPQFEIEYTGFVNGDDKTSITTPPTISCSANMQSNVGNYAISLSGGSGENYEVTSYTNGTLTIEKANQTIDWNQDLSLVSQYETIELSAVASSGLSVTYEVAPNSIVDIYSVGSKTLMECYGTGTLNVRATQSGNENFNAAETVINKLTVVGEGTIIDPSYPEISINVTTPGTLSSKINASKKYQIKSLTLSGSLNGDDIRYIREMAGRDVYGNSTNGILEKLNMSRASIVHGGSYYYATSTPSYATKYSTSDNIISDYMFHDCSTLTNLTLPQNCSKIGNYAFDGCLNLSTIIMSDEIQSIGTYAFNGNISLTRISIPEQTISIGNYAFQNCKGLSALILGSSVKTIGAGMLNGCPNIQEISLNDNNSYYSTVGGVLYDKDKSSLIIYPAGKQLQTFEIPDGVTEIKKSAFFGTSALKYLFLPESLTTIGSDAFKGCSNLSKLYSRPNTPPECENECFEIVSKSNCSLYVPRGSYSSYWAAPVWGSFLNIIHSNDLSVGGNIAKPDYGFEFTETTLNKGKFTYIPVSMNNVDPVVAFNCDIVLPEGVAFYKDASDQIVFKPSERFPMSQTINSNLLPNGVLRVISTSSSNEAFIGTDGILFYIPLLLTDADANEDSEYNLIVKDIEFTKKNQSGYSSVQSPDMSVTLTVGEYNMGDANGDGRITGADAVLAMSYFLGKSAPNLILKAADMNFDGKITSIDVVLITDELLAQNQSPKAMAKGLSNYNGNLMVSSTLSSSADVAFNIAVPSAYKFTAIQMDVTIPDGYKIKDLKVVSSNMTSHNVKSYQHPNGMTRIFISSDDNADFTSDNILSIELEELSSFHTSRKVYVEDVLAVEISGDEILEWDICGTVSNISDLSNISEINTEDDIHVYVENSTIYIKSPNDGVITLCDISGRSRSIEINKGITPISVMPGIYLINNNKIIVK